MSFVKHINVNDGSDRKFNDVTVSALPMDAAPELNSFNPVTSDGVARAIAGASGEVPVVTENDNGKVLKAVYDEGGPGVEWGDAGSAVTVDQSYDPTSENAQSGTAVAEAINSVNQVPGADSSDEGKVLTVNGSGAAEWAEPQGGTTYVSGSSATVSVTSDNSVTTNSVDVTSIEIGANVKSAIVQWTVNSTTTLPTVTSGGIPLGASVNNPASLTVGHVVQVSILNGTWVCAEFTNPLNPLGLPSHTIRCKFTSGYTPTMGDTQTLVDAGENIWDIYEDNYWVGLFSRETNLIEVIGANTTGVTDMGSMFNGCTGLTSVPLFDTSDVTNMDSMFANCESLTTVPLFDTSNVTSMLSMFWGCSSLASVPLFDTSNVTNMGNLLRECSSLTSIPLFDTSNATNMFAMFSMCTSVESGALALYQQASTQTTPPSSHSDCFFQCGSNTVSGAAELAQIPESWGGTGA